MLGLPFSQLGWLLKIPSTITFPDHGNRLLDYYFSPSFSLGSTIVIMITTSNGSPIFPLKKSVMFTADGYGKPSFFSATTIATKWSFTRAGTGNLLLQLYYEIKFHEH